MRKIAAMLGHAVQMVRKNIRNYILLSVTVTLSFSGLLVYLMYTDSSLYNQYKEVLSRDSQVITVSDTSNSLKQEQVLLEQLEQADLKAHYIRKQIVSRTINLDESHCISNTVFCIPSHIWGIYEAGWTKPYKITWLDGREESNISLGLNEILIPKSLYKLLSMEKSQSPTYELWLSAKETSSGGTPIYFSVLCTVVGIIEDDGIVRWSASAQHKQQYAYFPTYISQATADAAAGTASVSYCSRNLILYTGKPATAEKMISRLGMNYVSTYSQQQEANRELQLHCETKALITLALFTLLAINLYSCFTNTLEKRKFEVGVKRALGASGGAIMGQFLCEGIIVMLFNILVSIVLVTDCFLLYKFFYQRVQGVIWTIFLSGASTGMFAGVSICLTLLFSTLFAYKSTQVEIVRYLKSE